MPEAYKQDMPPPGGYQKINVDRVPMRKYFTGYQMIIGYLGITAGAAWYYYQGKKRFRRDQIELHSAHLATLPMLMAEKDRAFLKQVKKNRDEEAKLMANVQGWEVGKLYDEPVYKTLPADQWTDISMTEYYVHNSWWDFYKRRHFDHWI